MKIKYTITLLTLLTIQLSSLAQNKTTISKGIQWMSVEEVQEKMKTEPRKVYVDVYTDWCGWCKVMDKKTFTNKQLIDYINSNYYAIHLNAEGKDSILFKNKKYGPLQGSKTNELAADWMMNKLSYPTSIFFDENFRNPQPIPGYLEVPMMEMILKYFGENKHKSIPWEKYKKEFIGIWK
jgi:thioredoxin-related protein